MKVYRCGQKPNTAPGGLSKEQIFCLESFWAMEEQMGIRRKPQDTFLAQIPKIQLKRVSDKNDKNP